MNEQITIFQWLENQTDLDKISEAQMVQEIGAALGLTFSKCDFFGDWRAKIGKMTLCLEYSNYFEGINGGRRFIGADAETGTAGASSPCDSIDEAIEFFKRQIAKIPKQRKRVAENDRKI